tara:strand:+ start:109 stop:378 length:270 start_codon:yes stop_codon:yes gene_type:complete
MKEKQTQSHNKHLLIMIACCLVPIGLLIVFSVGGLTFGLPKDWVIWGALLLMIGAHLFMMRSHGECNRQSSKKAEDEHARKNDKMLKTK